MTSPTGDKESNVSRRRFIKIGGALVAAGVVGLGLGMVAAPLVGQNAVKTVTSTTTSVPTTVSTSVETQTLTDTTTVTDVETSQLTDTQTITNTETVTHTDTATLTGSTGSDTGTSASSSSSSSSSTSDQTPPQAKPFTIFWITDTQFLSESNPALYSGMTSWIADNWDLYNGKMVIHTGDLVQTGAQQVEWENADAAMSILSAKGIPYTWCAGNHDDATGGDATSGWYGNLWASSFDPTFASSRLNTMQYVDWVGDYHDGMNTAVSFTANGLDFLVVSLEWNAQPDAVQWAGAILDDPAYADHHVIIAPHAYINAFGTIITDSNYIDLTAFTTGLGTIMDAHSSNVFLTLNGHYATDVGYNTVVPTNFRNGLMFDRQDSLDDPDQPMATSSTPDSAKVGGATVTLLSFDTANNRITVSTYDTYKGTWSENANDSYSITMFSTPLPGESTSTTASTTSVTTTSSPMITLS